MASGAAGTVAPVQAELDPTFLRALRLFHSNSKDSIHQVSTFPNPFMTNLWIGARSRLVIRGFWKVFTIKSELLSKVWMRAFS